MRSCCFLLLFLTSLFPSSLPPAAAAPGEEAAFLGRWDITVPGKGEERSRYCWLEVTREKGELRGRYNSGGGAVFDLPVIAIENGELGFQYPVKRGTTQPVAVCRARIRNGRLEGTVATGRGAPLPWTGVRAPVWPAKTPKRKPGEPVALFNGKDLSGWVSQAPGRPMKWTVDNGILVNEEHGNNIYSSRKFRDFNIVVEFNVDPKSNSGVYLRGRYEIQIADGAGRPLDVHSQGALYGFIVPGADANKPAGEWQTLDATLIANRLTVLLNGVKIIDNAEVPGITGGALDAAEGEPGPILLQGDHGRVQFRKVVVTPLI